MFSPPNAIDVIYDGLVTVMPPSKIKNNYLCRPRALLIRGGMTHFTGTLVSYNPLSVMYYNGNGGRKACMLNITTAIYKVPGCRFPCAVFFDNDTGERVG